MKTYKNLYDKICDFENLHRAYKQAIKCKRYRREILEFSRDLEANLLGIQRDLVYQTYEHGSYREFIVWESKKRVIKAAPFRDRVIHHALCNIIEPIFDCGFIDQSYACRKDKGTHKAIKKLQSYLRAVGKQAYCLQCDISKYFGSIDHIILKSILRKKIADVKTLWLIEKIINSSCDLSATGIPIGNLTSQLFANIYLNELDRFIKHQLRGKYYLRYMDDFLILGEVKKSLEVLKVIIQSYLTIKLKLTLHPHKAVIFPVRIGIDFLGYKIFSYHKLLRPSTVKRFAKKSHCVEGIKSWLAYARFGNSWRLCSQLGFVAPSNFLGSGI